MNLISKFLTKINSKRDSDEEPTMAESVEW